VVIALIAVVAFVFLSRKEKKEEGGGGAPPSCSCELPPEYFSINRVYFSDISPYDFEVVVEITSGGRGVRVCSIGIDYGNGIGFQDNVIEAEYTPPKNPENCKIVLREDMAKWTLPSGQHPKIGQTYHTKVHLTLTDNTYLVWEGNTGYL